MAETLESAYRRHADELVRYASVMVGPDDAPDVVTDAMIAVFGSRGPAIDPASIRNMRAYLFRAVHHRVVDHGRSGDRRRRREEMYRRQAVTADRQEPSSIDARNALACLSEQQRAVTFLTYWCDLAPDDVAEMLGVGEGTVRKQLARARARLREVLDV